MMLSLEHCYLVISPKIHWIFGTLYVQPSAFLVPLEASGNPHGSGDTARPSSQLSPLLLICLKWIPGTNSRILAIARCTFWAAGPAMVGRQICRFCKHTWCTHGRHENSRKFTCYTSNTLVYVTHLRILSLSIRTYTYSSAFLCAPASCTQARIHAQAHELIHPYPHLSTHTHTHIHIYRHRYMHKHLQTRACACAWAHGQTHSCP